MKLQPYLLLVTVRGFFVADEYVLNALAGHVQPAHKVLRTRVDSATRARLRDRGCLQLLLVGDYPEDNPRITRLDGVVTVSDGESPHEDLVAFSRDLWKWLDENFDQLPVAGSDFEPPFSVEVKAIELGFDWNSWDFDAQHPSETELEEVALLS